MTNMQYSGPKRIVILGAGVAGLAAFDALCSALAACDSLPPGMRVTLVEAEDAAGGRAQSFPLDGPSSRHPFAPYGTHGPHGIHFIWGSYAHLARLFGDLGARLSPAQGTATYCAWMAPPDLVGDESAPARIAAVHVCDPSRPETAWNARARRVLQAFLDEQPAVRAAETFLDRILGLHLSAHDLLSYMDILFDEENLGPELRWTLLFSRAMVAQLGAPETNPFLKLLLGKAASDADIGELLQPLFFDHVVVRMKRAHRILLPLRLLSAGTWPRASKPLAYAKGPLGLLGHAGAALDLIELLARDAAKMLVRLPGYDPRASGFLKNALKAAFSNPYALDVGTMMRDAQFGLRSYEGALLRVFDGDDSRGMWEAIAQRAAAKLPGLVEIKRGLVAAAIQAPQGKVARVDLADRTSGLPPDVPTLRPRRPGPIVESIEADVVISTLLPRCLRAILPQEAPSDLTSRLDELGTRMNETLNLQLFFPKKLRLPFVDPPPGSSETPPFSISNLEGPFTIIVDLERAWSRPKFESIALDAADVGRPFEGTAWELVGTYPECFTFDPWAHHGRTQWPIAVQEKLAAITNDPKDFDASALDERTWVHDIGAPGRMPQPIFGEVRADAANAYQARWTEEASPIVVAQTMRLIAEMPGMAPEDARYLREQASLVEEKRKHDVRWALYRACQAENRFFSAEPGLFPVRPHARYETALSGLWVAGDWTRNGLNLQAMEAGAISGLQAACGVLERLRAGGLAGLKLPHIDPTILPEGAWDAGPEV